MKRFFAVLLSLCICIFLVACKEQKKTVPASWEGTPPPATVTLLAVGDNLIHDGIYKQAKLRSSDGGYDFTLAYENVAPAISSADIAVINQETVISPDDQPSNYPRFNSPAELGHHMLEIGFDVFNLANNHSLDMGTDGLESCLEYWNEQDAVTVGAYASKQLANEVVTVEKDGIVFAFLGATETTNGLKLSENSEAVLVLGQNEQFLEEKVKRASELADIVVMNTHWGNEYTHTPTSRQKELAKKLGNWGADIIIGHHPHVIQPAEYIVNDDRSRTLVFYSLGNFISAQNKGPRMVGALAEISITKEFGHGTTKINGFELDGVITHYDKSYKNIRNYLLGDYTPQLAQSHGVRAFDATFNYDYIVNTYRQVFGEFWNK